MARDVMEVVEEIKREMRKGVRVSQLEAILRVLKEASGGREPPTLERVREITSKIPISVTETVRELRRVD